MSEPIKIVQAPRHTLVLYEVGRDFRQIFTDGRRLPAEVNLPAYLGYSIGRWERETFVVGRYRRPNFGHLEVEMTYHDPTMYRRPFTIKFGYTLLADADIFEMHSENEKDCARISAAQTRP